MRKLAFATLVAGLGLMMLNGGAWANQVFTFKQTQYRWRNDDGGESSATWKAAQDTDVSIQKGGGNLRLRFTIDATPRDGSKKLRLQYSSDGGTWMDVPVSTTSAPFEMAASPHFANGAATTPQLDSSGSAEFGAGHMVEDPSNTTPGMDLCKGYDYTEVEYCLKATENAVAGQIYSFRVNVNDTGYDFYYWDSVPSLLILGDGARAPVASDMTVNAEEERPKDIVLNAIDPNGDELTYMITQQPAHGQLSGSGAVWRYEGDLNFYGSDSFKFKASDGTHESNEATVRVNVINTDDSPVVVSFSPESTDLHVSNPATITFEVTAVDPDPDGGKVYYYWFAAKAYNEGTPSYIGEGPSITRTFKDATDEPICCAVYDYEVDINEYYPKKEFPNYAEWRVSTDGSAGFPAITKQPVDATVSVGESATFSVTATGKAPLSYQWYSNKVQPGGGYAIPGATSSSWTTPPLKTTRYGIYVVVSNSLGEVKSNSVTATVEGATAAYIVKGPVNTTVIEGQSATFSVTAGGNDPISYQWSKDSGDGFKAIPGATSASYTTPPATLADSGARFLVRVTNDYGGADARAELTVEPSGSTGPGDLNGDRIVNVEDLTLVTSNFGKSSGDPGWDPTADANGDGLVNVEDLTEVTSNFGKSY